MDEELKKSILKTGTTILGIVCSDGIVMAADRQATAGNIVMNKNEEKVFLVNNYLVAAGTGIAADIKRVYEKLTTGICIMCIQKSEQKELGRGGDFSMEKARLYLTVDPDPPAGNVLKIYRAKNHAQPGVNPRGMKTNFKIIQGSMLLQVGGWHDVNK